MLASANQNRFRFTAIEGQATVTKPTMQSSQAVGDRRMVLLQLAARRFHTKNCSRFYSIEVEFYSQKRQFRFLSHPLEELEVT